MLALTVPNDELLVSPSPVSEEQSLLEAVANKDRVAFETLFRRYHSRIHQFVARMVNRHDLAEEVVADTLYAVWSHAHTYGGRSTISTWILGIAHKKALKAIEKDSRHRRTQGSEDQLLDLAEPDPAKNPERQAGDQVISQHVQLALDKLSVNHRAVVQLTAMGYSCAEIGEILDCPANTVKTRMFHARRQLSSLLKSAGVDVTSGESS